jgi:hypothetical protein
MQNIIEKDVFESFNNYSHFVVWWLAFSSILTFIKIGINKKNWIIMKNWNREKKT